MSNLILDNLQVGDLTFSGNDIIQVLAMGQIDLGTADRHPNKLVVNDIEINDNAIRTLAVIPT